MVLHQSSNLIFDLIKSIVKASYFSNIFLNCGSTSFLAVHSFLSLYCKTEILINERILKKENCTEMVKSLKV